MASIDIGAQSPPSAPQRSTEPARAGTPRRVVRAFWRSPSDQPAWARPALLAVALSAALIYGWRMGQLGLHEYYAPAVRSMADSWKAWLYNGYDPHSSITMDKLAGAFMLQALSVRVFGWHTWAVLLPQLVADVGAVLLLYRVVRRWEGPVAGLLAAGMLAATPMFAAVARSQVSDAILVFLVVAAAAAAQSAWTTGRLGPLLLCGLLVGLAFQTKMVQAWAVVPAFALAYLVAAPPRLPTRIVRLAASGVLMIVVSLWQVVLFALTPASSRPFVDGTRDNSLLTMIFQYNFSTRFGSGAGGSVGGPWAGMDGEGNTYVGYLLSNPVAPQVGWLYPLAGFGLVLGLLGWRSRRRGGAGRVDPVRAGYLMWGLWLGVHAIGFSTGHVVHSFYVVVLAPGVAALAAAGVVGIARRYQAGRGRRLLTSALILQGLWAVLICAMFASFRPWELPLTAIMIVAGLALLLRRQRVAWAAGLTLAGVLTGPLVWAVSTVEPAYSGAAVEPWAGPAGGGPGGQLVRSSGPNGSSGQTSMGVSTHPDASTRAMIDYLQAHRQGEKYLAGAGETTAAQALLLAGAEVLPMGGFSGATPFPTSADLGRLVAAHQLRFVILDGPGLRGRPDQQATLATEGWVRGHCAQVPAAAYHGTPDALLYDCRPA